jgi:hypothetical protein
LIPPVGWNATQQSQSLRNYAGDQQKDELLMSRVRLSLLAMLAVLAVTAISASAASAATEFTAAEGAKLKNHSTTVQELAATSGTVTVTVKCEAAKGEGTVKGTKTELEGVATYEKCSVAGLKAVVTNTCAFDFHVGGTVDVNGSKCAKVEVTSTKCVLTVNGEQKGLKEVSYKNSGANMETKGSVKGVNFETGKTGKLCGFATETATGTASYTGTGLTEGTNVK